MRRLVLSSLFVPQGHITLADGAERFNFHNQSASKPIFVAREK
jgi:hypothetical protein